MEEYTINYNGMELTVIGEYVKGEATVWYYPDGSGYPGSPSHFNIDNIFIVGEEVDLLDDMDLEDLEEIEYLTLQKIEL